MIRCRCRIRQVHRLEASLQHSVSLGSGFTVLRPSSPAEADWSVYSHWSPLSDPHVPFRASLWH